MATRIGRAGVAALLILGLAAAPAVVAAGAGGNVEITLDANFLTDGSETFTATGAFCASGTATTDDLWIVGNPARGLTFHVVKTFTCANGTDSIVMKIDAATHQGSGGDQGGWSVKGGSGAYAGARGGGVIAGVYDDSGVIDVYTGRLNR
jgi:hypothetical protein